MGFPQSLDIGAGIAGVKVGGPLAAPSWTL